jgi:hypothetical protein
VRFQARSLFLCLKENEVFLMQTIQTPPLAHFSPPAGARRRLTIASLFGERQFESINWRRLLQDGALVRLHIAGGSLFWAGLTYEDLGIRVEDDDVRRKLSKWVTLGKKRLLPEAYMKSLARIESSARYTLKERSFRTELGSFVPSSAYVAWRDTTQALSEQYLALRDEIIANHTTLTREVLGEYEDIASNTYQRLHLVQPELLTESRDQFIANYCQRIAAQIPSPDRIREKFDFKYLLLDGLTQVGETPTESNSESVEMDSMTLEQVRSETQQREWQRSILQHDLRVHAQERIDMVLDDFLSSVVGQLRTLTYDAVCDVLSTMQRRSNESMSPRSIVQLNNLLAQIRALNFYEDADLERMLTHIEQIVGQSPAERQASLADIQRTLQAIATATRATLLDLGEEPRSAREVGVSDYPTDSAVRQARAEIGLDMDAVQFANLAQVRAEVRTQRAEVSTHGMESLWQFLESETLRGARDV